MEDYSANTGESCWDYGGDYKDWFVYAKEEKLIDISCSISEDKKYLSEWITSEEIDYWDKPSEWDEFYWKPSQAVIIISAQTGAGKNHFIQRVLFPKLVEQHRDEQGNLPNDLMLILSNRIALTRQTKRYFSKLLIEYTGDTRILDSIQKLYTPEGVDKCCTDLGAVTICSYHQFWENESLRNKQFRYIVCDECHFFISDATFNPHTDKILDEVIQLGLKNGAVRVYMSATPEVVSPVIINREWYWRKEYVREIMSNSLAKSISNIGREIDRGILLKDFIGFSKKKYKKKWKSEMKKCEEDLNSLERYQNPSEFERKLSEDCLKVKIYHMVRRYDYIDKVYAYQELDEILSKILESESKWLIFVSSEREGEKLNDILNSKKVNCALLSRNKINSSNKSSGIFNDLIEDEVLQTQVLISTSVIDNGINIDNASRNITGNKDKVLNVVIDVFDKTEFLQMLGRVRPATGDKISLFTRRYTSDDLKQLFNRNLQELVERLRIDLPKSICRDLKYFRYSDGKLEYNTLAIVQLVAKMKQLLRAIRNDEPDFQAKFTSESEQALMKGILYQLKHTSNVSIWSRYVVDVLESSDTVDSLEESYEELASLPKSCPDRTITPWRYFPEQLTALYHPSLQFFNLSENVGLDELPDTLNDFIKLRFVSSEELKTIYLSENYVGAGFLKNHGIRKDSSLEKDVSQKYFQGKPLTSVLKNKCPIPADNVYELRSFRDNTNRHNTYYVFLKVD